MKNIILIISILFLNQTFSQKEKLRLITKEFDDFTNEYYYLNSKKDTIVKLNRGDFDWVYQDSIQHFYTGFDNKIKEFIARDLKSNFLFKVYTGIEFELDYLKENRIRIVDKNNLIGFANEKGKIIIKPQFEIVSQFSNGVAIFGRNCEKEYWEKENKHSDCNHFSIVCQTHGIINLKGEILEEGKLTFEYLANKYNWKPRE